MKQKTLSIISVISIIGLVLCVLEIISLKGEIDNLNTNIRNQYNNLNKEVNSIYSNVDDKLKKQASFLSDFYFEYGDTDIKNNTIEMKYYVFPKEYNPDKTTATLFCNGKEYTMQNNYDYTAFFVSLDIPVFSETLINKVVLETDGVRQIESIEEAVTPRWDVFPSVYASKSGQSRRSGNTFSTSGDCTITMESKGEITGIEKVYLVEYRDEEEISREEIVKDHDDNRTTFNFNIEKGLELPVGSTLTLCTEVVDSDGYIYRNIIEKVSAKSSTSIDYSDHLWQAAEASIYSPEGELLWEDEIMKIG